MFTLINYRFFISIKPIYHQAPQELPFTSLYLSSIHHLFCISFSSKFEIRKLLACSLSFRFFFFLSPLFPFLFFCFPFQLSLFRTCFVFSLYLSLSSKQVSRSSLMSRLSSLMLSMLPSNRFIYLSKSEEVNLVSKNPVRATLYPLLSSLIFPHFSLSILVCLLCRKQSDGDEKEKESPDLGFGLPNVNKNQDHSVSVNP